MACRYLRQRPTPDDGTRDEKRDAQSPRDRLRYFAHLVSFKNSPPPDERGIRQNYRHRRTKR